MKFSNLAVRKKGNEFVAASCGFHPLVGDCSSWSVGRVSTAVPVPSERLEAQLVLAYALAYNYYYQEYVEYESCIRTPNMNKYIFSGGNWNTSTQGAFYDILATFAQQGDTISTTGWRGNAFNIKCLSIYKDVRACPVSLPDMSEWEWRWSGDPRWQQVESPEELGDVESGVDDEEEWEGEHDY